MLVKVKEGWFIAELGSVKVLGRQGRHIVAFIICMLMHQLLHRRCQLTRWCLQVLKIVLPVYGFSRHVGGLKVAAGTGMSLQITINFLDGSVARHMLARRRAELVRELMLGEVMIVEGRATTQISIMCLERWW